MATQIIRQPDGLYVIFDSISETIIVWDATEDEIVEWFAKEAADRARMDTRRVIAHVAGGEPRRVYHQFAITWDEAVAIDRRHDGEYSAGGSDHPATPERELP